MKKLTKSRSNKVLMGVCGGFAEYFNIDANLVRIIWFIMGLVSFGVAGLAYFLCAIIMPEDLDFDYIYQDGEEPRVNNNSPIVIGVGLILIGAYLLIKIINPRLLRFTIYWPALLILLGLYIIYNSTKKS